MTLNKWVNFHIVKWCNDINESCEKSRKILRSQQNFWLNTFCQNTLYSHTLVPLHFSLTLIHSLLPHSLSIILKINGKKTLKELYFVKTLRFWSQIEYYTFCSIKSIYVDALLKILSMYYQFFFLFLSHFLYFFISLKCLTYLS